MAPVCFFVAGNADYLLMAIFYDILHSGILATEKDEQNCGNKNR